MEYVTIEPVDIRSRPMPNNKTFVTQICWRISRDDLQRLEVRKKQSNEPHWITIRDLLNDFEEMQVELKESYERTSRLRERLESLSQDMHDLIIKLVDRGEEDFLDRVQLSEYTKKIINRYRLSPANDTGEP